MGSLFVSHSRQDRADVARLCHWLTEQGFFSLFLDFDPERGLAPGAKWESELYAQLRRADGVLFVGSPASVTSRWCFAELAMARSLGKTIIPLTVRSGGAHSLLADTQAVDLTDDDPYGFERLRRRLSAAQLDPERMFDWDPSRPPFPGLESFEERDAAVFFGRHAETELLIEQLRSSRRRYTGRLMAVVGPSGSGKSSLVRAGMLPRLQRTQPAWVVLSILRPGDRPLRQLALVVCDAFRDAGATRSLQSVELTLGKGTPGFVALAEELSHLQPSQLKPPVLVFVDQAEELIAGTAGDEHARFLDLLHGATRGEGPIWLVLTLRSEFLSVLLQTNRGEFGFDDELLVGPLDASRLAEVIERPASRAGVSLEPGLVGRLIADTGGGDALPLLAHTLALLHERVVRRRGETITVDDYEDLGGVVGALRRSADEARRRLSERGLGDLVLPTLNRLVTVGPEGEPTRRRLPRGALNVQENEVVRAFIDDRLLSSSVLDGESVVEVTHEALLRQWPPLREAIERDRTALQLRSELERAAKDWERSGRRDDYLLPGERLAAARRLIGSARRTAPDLTALERSFLAASEAWQRSHEALKRRRTRWALTGLAVALVSVTALAVVAVIQRGKAIDQRDFAQAERLTTDAIGELAADPGQSLVLAMRAYAKKRTARAEGALRVAASQATPQLIFRGQHAAVIAVAFVGGGRQLASAANDGTVRVWDWRSPRTPPTILRGRQGRVTAVAFAPDESHFASAAPDGKVRVWDWRSPQTPPIVLRSNGYTVTAVAFAGDGRHLATTPEDGPVRVWDWRSPQTPPTILRRGRSIQGAVAFAADGRHLASAGGRGVVAIWDRRSPRKRPTLLTTNESFANGIAFAGDGRHLASAGEDGSVRVWDWRSPHSAPTILRDHQGPVTGVVFARDGRHLASTGEDGTMRVWAWRSPQTPPTVLRGHQGRVVAVAFGGDGNILASGGQDGTVRMWDWRSPRTSPTALHGDHGRVNGMQFTPDGRELASAGEDGMVRVWNWRSPSTSPTVLQSHQGPLTDVAFVDDGRHLASTGLDGTVRVWDWRSPYSPSAVLRSSSGYPFHFGVAFADDGRHVASPDAGEDATVRVWDRQSRRTPPTLLRDPGGSWVYGVVFAEDARHLASVGDDAIRVWDWRSPRTRPTVLRNDQSFVSDMEFADDGSHLATAGHDGTLRVWDWRSPRTPPTTLRGHHGAVLDVAFAADGRDLASAGEDGTVRVWDWRSPRTPSTILRGHQGPVTTVAFASDARHLASAGDDGIVRIWRCERCGDITEVLKLAHARVPREVGPR
jgi:WD40 repeat protein